MTGLIPLTIDAEVAAMYVGVAISAVLAVLALIISLRSLTIQKESARAAMLSAERNEPTG